MSSSQPSTEAHTQPTTKHYTTNTDLYNGWASTYDTDGNVLQKVDDLVFNERVIPLLRASLPADPGWDATPLRVLEIGCGTGRNTVKLLQHLPEGSVIYAIDISEGMLAEAKNKVDALSMASATRTTIAWSLLDIQTQRPELDTFVDCTPVDIIISTLVLEHVTLESFFSTIGDLLKPNGWAWISTMHPQIGAHTGAGYRRAEDNLKIHGQSYNYEIQEVVDAAKKHGLDVEGAVVEAGVGDEEDEAVSRFGSRARKCIGLKNLLGLFLRKRA